MNLFVVGLNHNTAPAEIRGKFAFSAERPLPLEVCSKLDEHFFFATCNRSELYGIADNAPRAAEASRQILERAANAVLERSSWYSYLGDAALAHLFRVASSLDAMVVGETEVTGQLKFAYQSALRAGNIGPLLNRTLNKALSVAKRVRTETGISNKPVSVASLAVSFVERKAGSLIDKRCLVIGSGEMGGLVVKKLKERGLGDILITNRTFEKAMALAEHARGTAYPWELLTDALALSDVVVVCAGADEALLGKTMIMKAMIARNNKPITMIDLAVPRGIDRRAGGLVGVSVLTIDSLKSMSAENMNYRRRETFAAERIVVEEVKRYESTDSAR